MCNLDLMKNGLYIVLSFIIFVSCKQNKETAVEKKLVKTVALKTIPIFNYNELKPLLHKNDDKTYVVNFWATWCAPCVKELPVFENLKKNYQDRDVEVVLVSLDFPDQIETKLKAFIKRKHLQSKVVVLDDPDQDVWIPKINEEWSGAIPATLIYNKSKRNFFESSFTYEKLEEEVLKFLK